MLTPISRITSYKTKRKALREILHVLQAQGGEVTNESGRAGGELYGMLKHNGTYTSFSSNLRTLRANGYITTEANAKRTYRIALTGAAKSKEPVKVTHTNGAAAEVEPTVQSEQVQEQTLEELVHQAVKEELSNFLDTFFGVLGYVKRS